MVHPPPNNLAKKDEEVSAGIESLINYGIAVAVFLINLLVLSLLAGIINLWIYFGLAVFGMILGWTIAPAAPLLAYWIALRKPRSKLWTIVVRQIIRSAGETWTALGTAICFGIFLIASAGSYDRATVWHNIQLLLSR